MLYDVVKKSDTNQSSAWQGTKLTNPCHVDGGIAERTGLRDGGSEGQVV